MSAAAEKLPQSEVLVLDNAPALRALVPQWRALWQRSGASAFLSPDWLLPWWRQFGTRGPRVAILREGAALLGVLPMYLLDEGRERKLLPAGVGLSDYWDALLHPALPRRAAHPLLHAVLRRAGREGVGSCTLAELPPGAALCDAAVPQGWLENAIAETPCPALRLSATLEQTVPARMLRKIRQSRHRAERDGGWSVDVATGGDALHAWEMMVRLHSASWASRGQGAGVLGDPRVLAFHREAVPILADTGLLRLYVLRLQDRVAAAYYTLAARSRLMFYLSAYDPAESFVSPGTLLLAAIIEREIARGTRELDFLRGAEPYKYKWGAADRRNMTRLLRRT